MGTPNQAMATFSKTLQPCTDLSQTWCNTPNKLTLGASEQMLVAYNQGTVVYACTSSCVGAWLAWFDWVLLGCVDKGTINSNLDSAWQGIILNSPTKLVDKCGASNGTPPEPECGWFLLFSIISWLALQRKATYVLGDSHAMCGITMDKTNYGV